ncbi:helix-turn-helix domain-containing protein [Streptomyces sp. 24-1644]|uniref:helix-turn-helix domain-containing protein n=1 Tax=Streptomyces sp. 24-1644 TaxID=3457315 RepID=UPI003FA75D77
MVAQTSSLPVLTWPLEPLRHSVALRRELDDFIAVAVREALDRGADWEEISVVTSISVSSLKNRFSRAQVTKAVHARQKRRPSRPHAPAAAVIIPSEPSGEASTAQDVLWSAQDALARALSHLHRSSGLSVRELASQTGVSPSYVYRLMAGERSPSWATVRAFALACDNDPNDLVDLWNAAGGRPDNQSDAGYDLALARFQGAIRGLHLAVARPDPAKVMRALPASHHEVSIVKCLLTAKPANRAEQLGWPVTAALTSALHGSHDRIRRRWRVLQAAAPSPRILTQAFG